MGSTGSKSGGQRSEGQRSRVQVQDQVRGQVLGSQARNKGKRASERYIEEKIS